MTSLFDNVDTKKGEIIDNFLKADDRLLAMSKEIDKGVKTNPKQYKAEYKK